MVSKDKVCGSRFCLLENTEQANKATGLIWSICCSHSHVNSNPYKPKPLYLHRFPQATYSPATGNLQSLPVSSS